jgi:hypothetical protein
VSVNFEQEPVGGVVLIIPALQSPDFASFADGWQLNSDGSAQFNGGLIVSGAVELDTAGDILNFYPGGALATAFVPALGAMLFYAYTGSSAQGGLVFSYATMAGTDSFGNPFNEGLTLAYVGVPSTNPPAGSISIYCDTLGNLKALTQAGNTRTIAAV